MFAAGFPIRGLLVSITEQERGTACCAPLRSCPTALAGTLQPHLLSKPESALRLNLRQMSLCRLNRLGRILVVLQGTAKIIVVGRQVEVAVPA